MPGRMKPERKTSGKIILLATLLFVTSLNCGVPGSDINMPVNLTVFSVRFMLLFCN